MNYNPSIYEINTRVWLRRFGPRKPKPTLADVPNSYWDDFVKKGIDYFWLMGVWKICDSVAEKYCFEDHLVKNYKLALKDWERKDVVGSPFAISEYKLNPVLGLKRSLLELKSQLNKKGMKLILDFVPNHFSAESPLINTQPEIFLSVDKEEYLSDSYTYYQPFPDKQKYFAHGRDPFFPAWQDTLQVNIFDQHARDFLTKTLLELTKICDGVRCDMAMLVYNNVFQNTWGSALKKNGYEKPQTEFWTEAITKVKNKRADFIFIAEAYWNLEWELQQLGFDYTYDKNMTDRLKYGTSNDIREHLLAEHDYQKKSLRFIENHDEERAVSVLGKEKSKAAAVIISTIEGLRFYYDGQFEGKKIKLPVQLGREPNEQVIEGLPEFYSKLLSVSSLEIFKNGKWKLLEPICSWETNSTYKNILAWEWSWHNEKSIVVINYSAVISTCRLKLDVRGFQEEFIIKDLLNDQTYTRSAEEAYHSGLYIELKPYHSHIFSF